MSNLNRHWFVQHQDGYIYLQSACCAKNGSIAFFMSYVKEESADALGFEPSDTWEEFEARGFKILQCNIIPVNATTDPRARDAHR